MQVVRLLRRALRWQQERPARPEGAYAVVTVEDRAGRLKNYAVTLEDVTRGLSIGSDPGCDIPLTGRSVRAVHARLQPASNHWVLQILPKGQKLPLPQPIEGPFDRVDRVPFDLEGHVLQVHDSYVW